MRIFLTGATGFVGSAVLADLVRDGHAVTGLVRSPESADRLRAAGAEAWLGDLQDHDSLRRGAAQADAVVHTAFDHDFSRMAENCETDRQAIETLGNALTGSDRQLLVTSGLPTLDGRVATENDVVPAGAGGLQRVSEQTAMGFNALGVRASVIRMPQVHDQRKQGMAAYLLAHARETGVSAFVGAADNRWSAVHRLDAARLYGLALRRGEGGRRYHAVSESNVEFLDIAGAIATRLGVPIKQISAEDSAAHFGWLDRIARMDAPASSDETQAQLNWRPREPAGLVQDIIQSN